MARLMIVMSIFVPLSMFAQNTQTFINFDSFETQLTSTYPAENRLAEENGVPMVEIGAEMFLLDNWLVSLERSASEDRIAKKESYAKKITGSDKGTVLGVRAHFPVWPHDTEVRVHPQLPILPYKITGEYMNLNQGVVLNVGDIKTFSMWAAGRNFDFTVGVRVRDLKNKLIEFPLGSLMYTGWRFLTYSNRFYSERAIDNIEKAHRLYPSEPRILRFDSIAIYRPGNQEGGDFVGYFGSSEISYLPAEIEAQLDINDEEVWGIIAKEQQRKAIEISGPLYQRINEYEDAIKRVAAMQGAQNNNNNGNNQQAQNVQNDETPAAN